jgi:hypothetical protein
MNASRRDVINATMTSAQMTSTVAEVFEFEHEEIVERLIIRFVHYTSGGNVTWKALPKAKTIAGISIQGKGDDIQRPLTVGNLVLQVQWKKGDKVMEDVNCNSEFMLEHMDSIGEAIRKSHNWIPAREPIYLIMDNAGGHGTNDAIEQYVGTLWQRYSVKIIHQVARGPEMNLLDLGAWMSLQSAVEKHFRGSRNDVKALVPKVEEAWSQYDSSVFHSIFGRWLKVLQLVIADKGDNSLVNSHRGMLFSAVDTEPNAVDE